ncbi:MAG: RHS repeat-associated core domain-containing protein [Acidobacteriota bacterium]
MRLLIRLWVTLILILLSASVLSGHAKTSLADSAVLQPALGPSCEYDETLLTWLSVRRAGGRTSQCTPLMLLNRKFQSAWLTRRQVAISIGSTGKERDQETGLDYFGARYFSGAQGRFTSPDPENANAMASDPQSWNMYAYGRNNPLSYVDPDGLAYRVCQVDENGKETNCTTHKNQLSDKQFEQFKKDNRGTLIFAGGKVYGVNEDGSRGAQTGTYKQTDVDIDNPAFSAVAQGIQAASPVTDPRFIAGFYGASVVDGLALYGGGAFAGGQLTTLGLQTGAATATEGSTALAGTLNLSKHAIQRMAERGFTRDMIQATIKNGTRYWDPKNGTFNYVLRGGFASGKDALVGLNPVTNTVTTVLRGTVNVGRMIPF